MDLQCQGSQGTQMQCINVMTGLRPLSRLLHVRGRRACPRTARDLLLRLLALVLLVTGPLARRPGRRRYAVTQAVQDLLLRSGRKERRSPSFKLFTRKIAFQKAVYTSEI